MSVHPNSEFTTFIRKLLRAAQLTPKYIDILTNQDNISQFKRAFTHKSIDSVNNYEYYEILGDVTSNKITVWYYHHRFPEIFKQQNSVEIMARLKMNGISKLTYSRFARNLGFEQFILYEEKDKGGHNISTVSLLEDVFESFIGCLEYLIDSIFLNYSGYGVVYIFMTKLMDNENISLELNDLYDDKSKLNTKIVPIRNYVDIKYVSKNIESNQADTDISKRVEVKIVIYDKQKNIIFESTPAYGTLKMASQNAAKNTLNSEKFKEILKVYEQLKLQQKQQI